MHNSAHNTYQIGDSGVGPAAYVEGNLGVIRSHACSKSENHLQELLLLSGAKLCVVIQPVNQWLCSWVIDMGVIYGTDPALSSWRAHSLDRVTDMATDLKYSIK